MIVDASRLRHYLQDRHFKDLFVQELGWEYPSIKGKNIPPLDVLVGEYTYRLTPVAHKRGMVVYTCEPDAHGLVPDYPTQRKIEKDVAKAAYEHLIIFTDATKQVWQWVKREPGQTAACRRHTLYTGQSGDSLLSKLQLLAVDMDEEDDITVATIAGRVKRAFDVEGVTKRFYDRFQKEYGAFLDFIKGIQALADREWYAALMLNRLMFVYFIQKKGFLNGEHDYLERRLARAQGQQGVDSFHSFYRYFLLRLFHEGLGQQARTPDLEALLGNVPYLNGGLFDVHQLERDNPDIHIPDEAFERIFAFFQDYDWTLDQRAPQDLNRSNGKTPKDEINPDVLGYIFEKYINQKQMGAYYTKEDITDYIGRNTVIPFLLGRAEKGCAVAFRPDGPVWGLLRDDPDRYIYPAVRFGTEQALPTEIVAGLDDITRRGGWSRPAAEGYGLPTETWREHVARRTRYEKLRARLTAGEVHAIDDLVTLNLDVRIFAEDVVRNCEGPELLRAFYRAVERVTVLDPTCGSGAFLFAALNILEPLYEACLDRMQGFVDDADRPSTATNTHATDNAPASASAPASHAKRFSDFRKILDQIRDHPNRDYFILKSIIINNLYGVDIMEEAVEICKLRLFLKLVSRAEGTIEPLPDIDFNIRAGNTLVGFATLDEVRAAVTRKFDFENTMERIGESAEIVDRAFRKFHQMQTTHGMDAKDFTAAKRELRDWLGALRLELDRYLAGEYGIEPGQDGHAPDFVQWRADYQPFHWCVEFYGIIETGGFDVVIGNPPYISVKKIDYSFPSLHKSRFSDIYAHILLRSLALVTSRSRLGMIIPLSVTFSEDFGLLRKDLCSVGRSWFSSYDNIPAAVFSGVSQRCTIWIGAYSSTVDTQVSPMYRWRSEYREALTSNISYTQIQTSNSALFGIPKLASYSQEGILNRLGKVNFINTDTRQRLTEWDVVSCDSDVVSGTPVFRDTRVPGTRLFDYLLCDKSLGEFYDEFLTVTKEHVLGVPQSARERVDQPVFPSCESARRSVGPACPAGRDSVSETEARVGRALGLLHSQV